jgi:hypothetical protein
MIIAGLFTTAGFVPEHATGCAARRMSRCCYAPGDDVETIAAAIDLRQEQNTLFVTREQLNVPIPQLYRLTQKPDVERGDLWRVMRWDAPGCMLLDSGTRPALLSVDAGPQRTAASWTSCSPQISRLGAPRTR